MMEMHGISKLSVLKIAVEENHVNPVCNWVFHMVWTFHFTGKKLWLMRIDAFLESPGKKIEFRRDIKIRKKDIFEVL